MHSVALQEAHKKSGEVALRSLIFAPVYHRLGMWEAVTGRSVCGKKASVAQFCIFMHISYIYINKILISATYMSKL